MPKPNVPLVRLLGWILLTATALLPPSLIAQEQAPFVTTWKTDNSATTGFTVTIPTTHGSYDYEVDWDNDGIYDSLNVTGPITHDYGVAGTYTIRIRGQFPHFRMQHRPDAGNLIDIAQWGDIEWNSMFEAFDGCLNLTISATDAPDLARVTDMRGMFLNCRAMNSDINHWDVSNVTTMGALFHAATSFNQPLDRWDVGRVSNFSNMFLFASTFNQDIGKWDVSNARNMSRMFRGATRFDQPIGAWKTDSVTSMAELFRDAAAFNQDIGDWNTASVTDMSNMFDGASAFNQPLGKWNVTRVADMAGMFRGSAYDQDLSSWDVGAVTDMKDMFLRGQLSQTNYDLLLIGWAELDLQTGVRLDAGNTTYCAGASARAAIRADYGWTINDGGASDQRPTAVCTDLTVTLDDRGTYTLAARDLDGGSTEACAGLNLTYAASRLQFGCADIGATPVVLSVSDFSFNTDTCHSTVTVLDAPLESLVCPGDTSVVAATGDCEAAVLWEEPAVNCTTTLGTSHSSGELFALGETEVFYTASQPGYADLGCSFRVTVTSDLAIDSIRQRATSCHDSADGEAVVTVSGGRAPFAYDWEADGSGDFDDGALAEGLPVGPHRVTVRDAAGCRLDSVATIAPRPLSIESSPDDIRASANTNGCAARVSWPEPELSCTPASRIASHESGDSFPLGTSTVTYVFTGMTGELLTCSFQVTVTSDLGLSVIEERQPDCAGAPNGMLSASAAGGARPLWYSWLDSSGDTLIRSPEVDRVAAGTYLATVVDRYGCRAEAAHALDEPGPIQLSATVIPMHLGRKIDLTVSGGSGGYACEWAGTGIIDERGQEDIRVIANGTFDVAVTDRAGCRATHAVEVADLPGDCVDRAFDVYPNPTRGGFTFSLVRCAYPVPITVRDALGRRVATTTSHDINTDMDLQQLSRGVYFLVVGEGKQLTTRALVVQ